MAEEIKELIAKIQQEGLGVAKEQAAKIEAEAKAKAEAILAQAKKEASSIISEAREESAKTESTGRESLRQAGRDLLLNLRKEINSLLERIILFETKEALSTEELPRIINYLIKASGTSEKDEIVVSLKKEELEKIEKSFLAELKEEIKAGLTLKPSEEISGGFTISLDGGKSHFDFTDKALAEYLSSYLKPRLAELLKEAVK